MSQEKLNDNQTLTNQNEKIIIKKEAFRNMLTHVLNYGSIALEESVEVMGVCLGNVNPEDEKVTIINAIPVMHGPAVSVGFSKKEIEIFQQIENQYKETIIGWYLSRPGWGLDFTNITIANHQYFQNEKFPRGFCIVFDHTQLIKDNHLNFEIYRLDDYTKSDKYTTVQYEIEIPSSLEYFKWIQKFMEDLQKKNPILIKEINEIAEEIPEDLQEIPLPKKSDQMDELIMELPEIKSLISGYKQGSEKFSELFINTLQTQVQDWINDIEKGDSRGTEYISKAISKMRETVVSGLLKVNNWFKKTLNEIVFEFKNSVLNYVDKRIDDHRQITQEISVLQDNLIDNLNNIIDTKIQSINSELESVTNLMNQDLIECAKTNNKIEEVVKTIDNSLTLINNQVDIFSKDINKKIETSLAPIRINIDEKVEKLNVEMQPFKNNYSEISNLLDKLQKIITDFRNLT